MSIKPYSECIKCYFGKNSKRESEYLSTKVEVYLADATSLYSGFSYLKNYVTEDEQLIANSFNSDIYRKTYISCHALLRLILAAKLNMEPSDLSIIKGSNNKPVLSSNQAYFNLSHTKDAFAFAISRDFHVGIDLEKIKQNINLRSIINKFFNVKEREYILDEEEESFNRFFLLWTRKEAFLKALGTGIIENLNQIIVSEPVNFIKRGIFDNVVESSLLNEYFMYSYKIKNHFLCIALPHRSSISFYNLNEEILPVN